MADQIEKIADEAEANTVEPTPEEAVGEAKPLEAEETTEGHAAEGEAAETAATADAAANAATAQTESSDEFKEADFTLDKETIDVAKDDLNSIYKEGAMAAKELKDAFSEIKEAFNFGSLFK